MRDERLASHILGVAAIGEPRVITDSGIEDGLQRLWRAVIAHHTLIVCVGLPFEARQYISQELRFVGGQQEGVFSNE